MTLRRGRKCIFRDCPFLSHPAIGRGQHTWAQGCAWSPWVEMNSRLLLGEAAGAEEGAQGKLLILLGPQCAHRPQETLSSVRLQSFSSSALGWSHIHLLLEGSCPSRVPSGGEGGEEPCEFWGCAPWHRDGPPGLIHTPWAQVPLGPGPAVSNPGEAAGRGQGHSPCLQNLPRSNWPSAALWVLWNS